MLKQKTLDISASNIANLGTELEKKCRVEASNCEASWKNAGKVPCVAFVLLKLMYYRGLEIWRIEHFKVVSVPHTSYG